MGKSRSKFKRGLFFFSGVFCIFIWSINVCLAQENVGQINVGQNSVDQNSIDQININPEAALTRLVELPFGRSSVHEGMGQGERLPIETQSFQGVVRIQKGMDWVFERVSNGSQDSRIEVNRNSRFSIASITKQFIGITILLMERDGLLNSYDSLGKHLPGAPVSWSNLSLIELMNHHAGVYDQGHKIVPFGTPWSKVRSPNPIFYPFSDLLPSAFRNQVSPPTPSVFRAVYSNSAYTVLAAVIEAVSGRRYQDEVRLRIFQPLGLRDSGFLTDFGHHGVVRSVGYTSESNKTIDPDCNITVFAGSADMFSTVDDLSLWSQALMGNDFLTPAEKAKVFKAPSQYSYGFKLNDGAFWHRAFHTGYLPGFKSYISMNFTHGYSVIVLSNDSSQVVEAFGEDISTMLVSGKSKFL